VTSRHAQFGDDIYADHQAFWWSWAERIAPVTEPAAAAGEPAWFAARGCHHEPSG
jgi:hypothetical protein